MTQNCAIDLVSLKNEANDFFKAKDYDKAIALYSALVESSHGSQAGASDTQSLVQTALSNRALALFKLDRFEDAVKDCTAVLASEGSGSGALPWPLPEAQRVKGNQPQSQP